MLRLVKGVATLGIFAFLVWMTVLIGIHSLRYFSPYSHSSPFLTNKVDWFVLYLPALYGHIVASGIVLMIGFLSLLPFIRQRYLSAHRLLGKLYAGFVLLVAAPCGGVMSFFAVDRGFLSFLNFLLLSLFWWYFTYRGYTAVRAGDIVRHRQWMWRSYALTLSAICLRWYSALFAYFLSWRSETAYVTAAWLSWLPNWALIEVLLRVKSYQKF